MTQTHSLTIPLARARPRTEMLMALLGTGHYRTRANKRTAEKHGGEFKPSIRFWSPLASATLRRSRTQTQPGEDLSKE